MVIIGAPLSESEKIMDRLVWVYHETIRRCFIRRKTLYETEHYEEENEEFIEDNSVKDV